MSHTPGPWRFFRAEDDAPAIVQRGNEGGCVIRGMTRERETADASLIAASPDLLAALTWAMSNLEFPNATHMPSYRKHYESASAAIKKAKGERP